MSSMRQTTMITSSSSSSAHPTLNMDGTSPLDGSLDLLLEDLQNSVARPVTGVTTHVNGPSGNSISRMHVQREVRVQRNGGSAGSVEYLQPANSTTVVRERTSSPMLLTTTTQQPAQHTSYKTYKYESSSSHQTPVSGLVVDGTPRGSSVSPTPASGTRHNLNELDTLLVDLHHAQQSTPHEDANTAQQITRTVRTYQFDNTYGTPNSVRRELYPPSPKAERSVRAKSPPQNYSPAPMRSPSPIRSSSPMRAPSPNRKVTTTVKTYTYEMPADGSRPAMPLVQSPTVKTYSYQVPGNEPTLPPQDTVITYKYTTSTIPKAEPVESPIVQTYKYPSQPAEREPLIEPKSPPRVNNTYISYNYSSNNQSTHPPSSPGFHKREPPHRAFPSPSPPAPSEPPKRLDELMASFSDAQTLEMTDERHHPERPVPPAPLDDYPDSTPAPMTPSPPAQERIRSKNVAGPPVYYPPGVEMFARKDEPVHAKLKEGAASGAGDSGKASGGGVAAVPVCLPLCCAMPCVIM